MFTITNGPSAIVHLLQTVYGSQHENWYNITLFCSALVIFGKASNFILFCLCSKHFRSRLFSLAQKKVHEKLGKVSDYENLINSNDSSFRYYIRECSGSTSLILQYESKMFVQYCPEPKGNPLETGRRFEGLGAVAFLIVFLLYCFFLLKTEISFLL